MQKKRTLPTLKSLGVTGTQRKNFFSALQKGDVTTVQAMLDRGMPPDIFNGEGKTALHIATYAEANRSELLLALIQYGADVTVPNEAHHGGTLLHRFVKHPDVIAALLEKGLNPKELDKYGSSAVYSAMKVAASNLDALRSAALLIQAGAPLQNDTETPGELQLGAELKTNALHPIHLAAKDWNAEALNLLLSAGANALQPSSTGTLPLQSAVLADPATTPSGTSFCSVIDVFSQHQIDINAVDIHGRTALHTAIEKKRPEVVKLLLDRGATLDAPVDVDGHTPRKRAEEQGDPAIIHLLNTLRARDAIDSILKKTNLRP